MKKIVWQNKGGWKTQAETELSFKKFCIGDRPQINLEKDLGIELWLYEGSKEKSEVLESQPHVTVHLHTYKLTYVIASASIPVESSAVSFSHRLKPTGKEIIEVDCLKKK